MNMIKTFEALFLLALDEADGEIVKSIANDVESALAGAVLVELVLEKRIELADERIVVTDQTPMGHPVLDKALFDILDSARPRKLKYWINTLTYQELGDEVGHQLVEQGILTRKKKRLQLVAPSGENAGGNISVKYGLKNRLRGILLAGQDPELSEKILLAFLYYGDLVKLVFTHGERKTARKRLQKLIASEAGSGLSESLEEIVAVACQPKR